MARLAIVVMISNSDAHVVAPHVMGDLIIAVYWELAYIREPLVNELLIKTWRLCCDC